MNRKKILWLVSWYPNRYDRFNGDFIQRHAQSASIDNDIFVLYLQDAIDVTKTEVELHTQEGLTEQVIYYKKAGGLIGNVIKQINYFAIYKKAIKAYIKKYGLPHCVHVHVPWKAGFLALWMRRKYGISVVVSEHWGIYHPDLSESFIKKSLFFRILVKQVIRNANILIVVSKKLGEDINKMVLSKEYHVVPNVVNERIFKPAEQKYSRFTFLHVSNMVQLKNVANILVTFRRFLDDENADVQLILIGNRDDKYVSMAHELGLLKNSVFFKGEISYKEVALEMQKANCLILNSSYETFSCVVAEALCCGIPVISTRVGVVPDVITKENGIQINNPEGLIKAMKQVYHNFSFYNNQIISRSAVKEFNYSTISAQFDHIYNKAVY